MSGEPLLAQTNDMKTHTAYLPRYRFARVALNNITSSSVSLALTSTQLMEWKLPAGTCFNLARSFVSYQYAVPALANNFAVTHEAGIPDFCSWASFGTGGGVNLVDLNSSDKYGSVIRNIRTPTSEFMGNDISSCHYPCNQLNTTNLLPFPRSLTLNAADCASTTSYLEPQYLNIAPAANTALFVNRYLPLNAFKDTFLSYDKDICFPIDMYLRFNTQQSQKMGFYTTNPANPGGSGNYTLFSAGQTPSNFINVYLYLAIEENKVIVDSLNSSMKSGSMKYQIPYTYSYRFGQAGGSTSANFTVTLTRQFGDKLKRLLYVPFHGNEYGPYTYCHSNVNGALVKTIQTTLDSRPLTDYPLNCYNPQSSINVGGFALPTQAAGVISGGDISGDDYREAKKAIIGTCIQKYSDYQTNWFYADQWGLQDSLSQTKQLVSDANIHDGLSLTDGDHVYSIMVQTPYNNNVNSFTNLAGGSVGIVHYIFALFIRNVHVTSNGIEFTA